MPDIGKKKYCLISLGEIRFNTSGDRNTNLQDIQTTAGLQRGPEDGVVKATSSLVDSGKVKKQSQLLKNAVKRK